MPEILPEKEQAQPAVVFSEQDAHFIDDTYDLLVRTEELLPQEGPEREREFQRIFRARNDYIKGLRDSSEPSADSVHLVWAALGVSALHSREGTKSMGEQLLNNPLLTDAEREQFFETASTLWSHRHKGITHEVRTAALKSHIAGIINHTNTSPALRLAYRGLALGATIEEPDKQVEELFDKEVEASQQPSSAEAAEHSPEEMNELAQEVGEVAIREAGSDSTRREQ